jgi:DNA polymerase III subunit delta
MTIEQIYSDFKNKTYKPVYFLMGEESYYIDEITEYLATHVLTEAEKNFNQTILYGKDTEISTVINSSKRYPMMANNQVVIVKEAQSLKDIDKLIFYIEKPLKSTILVINYKYKSLDKKKKLYKALDKGDYVFESNKLYDDKLPDWINIYLKKRSCSIEPEACRMLVEYLGNDLNKIANELKKLMITLPNKSTPINKAHIEKNIGISKDYNNFELQKAIATKDVLKANRIINHFAHNPVDNPMMLTLTSLYFFFMKVIIYHSLSDKSPRNAASALKVNPFFVKDYEAAAKRYNPNKLEAIISYLREYDLKSKGKNVASSADGDLLKELVFKIIH